MTDKRGTAREGDRPKMRAFFYYWAPLIIYCLLIFFQSSHPSPVQTPDLPYMDKILHAGAYALLGFLCYRALRTLRIGRREWLLVFLSTLLTGLYGVSDELHQHFVSARDADIMDAAADFAGGYLGVLAARFILMNHHRKS